MELGVIKGVAVNWNVAQESIVRLANAFLPRLCPLALPVLPRPCITTLHMNKTKSSQAQIGQKELKSWKMDSFCSLQFHTSSF